MIAVIFEVSVVEGQESAYLELATQMRPLLDTIDGFISIERFKSIYETGKILSLSFWRDEESVATWRQLEAHRKAQTKGREEIFQDYRLRIAGVIRDYGMNEREQTPVDSRTFHETTISDEG